MKFDLKGHIQAQNPITPIDFKKIPINFSIEILEVYRVHDSNPIIKVRTIVVMLQEVNVISNLAW